MGLFLWRGEELEDMVAVGVGVALDATPTLVAVGLIPAQLTDSSHQQTAAFKPEKFTSVCSSAEKRQPR